MTAFEWDYPVEVRQNSDDVLSWGFAYGDVTSSTPVDLTGAYIVLSVWESEDSDNMLFRLTSDLDGGITIGTLSAGGVTGTTINADVSHSITSTLQVGEYYYDILVAQDGIQGYYAFGTFTVNQGKSTP